jgi:eukaryotic-like serine/threonine-protein kinase
MVPQEWQRVREVLADALALKPADRPPFLDKACASDNVLRQEVESLLSSSEEARSSFLQSFHSSVGLTPGAKLGDYEIVRLVGSGGMGEVYRARDRRLGRDVAIKVLPALLSRDPDRLRRFEQEAQAAAALDHPNVLAVFQMGTYQGAPYLVSELLEGATLREELRRRQLPVRKAIDYGVQISRGLAVAHEKGIIHRDLKPENVFLTRDGRAKLLDFGLAKLTERRSAESNAGTASAGTEPGVVMGTVGYMSPEQVNGSKVDHRTDIFAFGAILYEMLTGKRAFQKPTSAETMTAILNEDPADISVSAERIPPALQRITRRCLEKNPEQRFQSASDLSFALEALSDSGSTSVATVPSLHSRHIYVWSRAGLTLVLFSMAVTGITLWLRSRSRAPDRSAWMQLTNLPDSVTQPALSADGRMVTFVRGPSTFVGPGQIYVKMLPNGDTVQLTNDNLTKMGPAFSPDGDQIAYTALSTAGHWDTWRVPLLGGQPHLWLPNASGLAWSGRRKIVFSEIKDNDIHMVVEVAEESRVNERDVYVPAGSRGMAHRAYPSPNGKWALVVEMDRGLWLPCRLVAMDGKSAGREVGPPGAVCTSAAWSPDGKWMYLNSAAGGAFHIWKQWFPDGKPVQLTSGPTEEQGIAMAPDGRSFVTSVGLVQSSVWIHDSRGDRQVSLEGYSIDPKFSPDGKRLCYRILRGGSVDTDPSELRVVELDSGRNDPLLPGFSITGELGLAYDISPDSKSVVVSARDNQGRSRLWTAPLDSGSPPREIPNVQGDQPFFGRDGQILFRSVDGTSAFAYRVHEDGSGLQKVLDRPIAGIDGLSQDRQWMVVKLPASRSSSTAAFPLQGGTPVIITSNAAGSPSFADINVQWSPDGRQIFIPVNTALVPVRTAGRTYVLPLPRGHMFPQIPTGGLQSEAELAALPGAHLISQLDLVPGPGPGEYAFLRATMQRNLFRIPLQ